MENNNYPNEVARKWKSDRDELLGIAKLILKEWEAPTEGELRGTLVARLSQYAAEARQAIANAEGVPAETTKQNLQGETK